MLMKIIFTAIQSLSDMPTFPDITIYSGISLEVPDSHCVIYNYQDEEFTHGLINHSYTHNMKERGLTTVSDHTAL